MTAIFQTLINSLINFAFNILIPLVSQYLNLLVILLLLLLSLSNPYENN